MTATAATRRASKVGSAFLRACRREPVDHTPIWLMRQAGRYMSAYRQMRARYSFIDMVTTPELACEITLQPVRSFGMDAAIVFADILTPLDEMGMDLEYTDQHGPVLHDAIADEKDVRRLRVPDGVESVPYTLEAIRLVARELEGDDTALIGFAGGPFTLASYAIEGGGSSNQVKAKAFMFQQPAAWHLLMSTLAEVVGRSLLAQAEAGADALQLFDSWAGALTPDDYRDRVLPYTRRALEIASRAGVPLIHFGTGTAGILELIGEAGGDVVAVDWRIDLGKAWDIVGHGSAVQGNLDPVTLLAGGVELKSHALAILQSAAGRPGHIFNLGHGVLPETPEENVERLVDIVQSYDPAASR